MIKTVALVSLSSGILGEPFVSHEVELGLSRLKEYGLKVKGMPHAMKGLDYVSLHPEKRANDLIQAFQDPEVDMILCAIGGDDTYRLLPFLFEEDRLKKAVSQKVFLGFSDTTINHFMLNKVGLKTFYGQAFLSDICELDSQMLPYTRKYFEELIQTGSISAICPSEIWYESRLNYGPDQIGTPLISHPDHGFELLQGPSVFSGEILGGCIDSIFDMFDGSRYEDMPRLCSEYGLFPSAEDWCGKILLLETSEEKMSPQSFGKALEIIGKTGIFSTVSGIIVGKPMDETYSSDYKKILVDVISNPDLPIVFNLNIGHALPRCIIPFGKRATVNVERQIIEFEE